jgi:hypothetical protein
MELGFNGEVLDLKPKTVAANSSSALTMEEEDLIKDIVGKKIISSAGGLYKAGIVIANCRAVTQAAQRSQAALLEAIGENLEKRKAKERLDRLNARAAFRKWVDQGRKETEDRDPDIKSKKDAIAIIRVLLPKLSAGGPKVTLTSFKTLKTVCIGLETSGGGRLGMKSWMRCWLRMTQTVLTRRPWSARTRMGLRVQRTEGRVF